MGLFDRFRRKPKVTEEPLPVLDESSLSTNMKYMPIIGQLKGERSSLQELLTTYRIMEKDAVISGALELYGADSTQVDSTRSHSVWIECSSASLKEELEDFLYNVVKIEDKIFSWAYTLARDGRFFLRTYDGDNSSKWYFEPVSSKEDIYPLYVKGDITSYYYQDGDNDKGKVYPKEEFIPFLLILDDDVDTIKLRKGNDQKEDTYKTIQGESILKGAIIAWKVLTALEDTLILARVGKSSVFNMVKIEVGNASRKEADQIIKDTKKLFKTTEVINLLDQSYRSANNPIAANENIYIPTRNGKGDMDIKQVGGEYELKAALDLDYFRNKLFAALHVPKEYLGFSGDATSVLGDNSLTRLDERYARSVKRVQNGVRSGIRGLCDYYLKNTRGSLDNLPDYKIGMTGVSSAEEKTRREELDARVNTAQNIVEMAISNFPNQVDRAKLFKYVFNDVLGLSTAAISNLDDSGVEVTNLGLRGTGYGDPKDFTTRKYITIRRPEVQELQTSLESTNIYLDIDGKKTSLKEALESEPVKSLLTEAGYKELLNRVKTTDPDRVKKSKKLTVSYIGLNKNGDLMFKVSSGTTKGKFWYQTIRLLDLPKAIEAFAEDGEINDKDIVRYAIEGDLAVYCNDPSFKYYGWQWMATEDKYGIVPEGRPPVRNNKELKGALCKHLYVVLQVLPFWNNRIVADLRKQFFRTAGVGKGKKVVYKPGRKRPYKTNDEEPQVTDPVHHDISNDEEEE